MRKATRKLFFSGTMGAIFGGIIIVLVLSMIGAGKRAEVENTPTGKNTIITVAPSALSSVSVSNAPSPSPSSQPEKNNGLVFKNGGFSYVIPKGYRVANKIMALDEKNAPVGYAALTLTKGLEQQEAEYVKLINQLQEDRAATEAPQFLPGQTISVSVATKNLQDSDARLAHGSEKLTTSKNITGNRYIKVEGLFPYDATYLSLPNGKSVSVMMNYGSTEPLFDEAAYLEVINSIQGL